MLAFLPLGLTGAAFGFALGVMIANVYAVARTAQVLNFELNRIARLAWAPYLGGFVMIAVVLPLERLLIHAEDRGFVVGLVLIALEAALGLVVYFACLLVMAPVTAREMQLAVRLIDPRRERQPRPRRLPASAGSTMVITGGHALFSVVMPAHNTAPTIGAAIESVLAQSRQDFEVFVVDDGSTDGTADAVDRYASDPRVHLLRRSESGGPGAARNTAFAVARTPLVCMLDSDDLWLPHYLETAAEALAAHPSVALFCAGNWTLEEPPGLIRRNTSRHGDALLDADEFLLGLVEQNFVVNSTVTVRREALLECGGCDPSLRAAVDLDLWLRLAAAGHGAIRVGEPLTVYRVRSGSIQHARRN